VTIKSSKIMQKLTFNFQNGQKIIQKIGLIDEFKGKWSQQIYKDFPLDKLRILALSENAKASVRLEQQLHTEIVDEVQWNQYINASNFALNRNTKFSYETIENLYQCLESDVTNKDLKKYRKIVSKLTLFITHHPIAFRSTPAQDIVGQLKQEVYKTSAYLDKKQLHPLIAIADFVYEFSAICPFETRNLQLSRLIAMQLLAQFNYGFMECTALEAVFEARKEQYHVALGKALHSRNQVKEDISTWIIFFLECIELSINHLEQRLKPLKAALETLDVQKNDKQIVKGTTKVEKSVKKTVVEPEKPTNQLFEDDIIENQSVKNKKNIVDKNDNQQTELNAVLDKAIETEVQVNAHKPEIYLSPRQKKLKKYIIEKQPVRLGDLKAAFPEINQHILKKDLLYMHRLDEIQKIGDFKNTVYTANK
jgi:Fic family protein